MLLFTTLLSAQDEEMLYFSVENNNYFINNEYFNDFQKGYTAPGSWIRPSLLWNIDNELTVKAGVFLQHNYGTDTLAAKRMSITATWDMSPTSTLTIGDYNSVETYLLPDYMFDKEIQFTNPFDQGVVYEWLPGRLETRLWVAWKRYINAGDPFREEIFGGISGNLVLSESDISRFNIPFAFTAYHKGGQIDASDLPLQNVFNYRIGFKYDIGTCGLYGSYNKFINDASIPETFYDNGEAIDMGAFHNPGRWYFDIGYWRANKFYSPFGKPMYSSISSVEEGFNTKERSLMKSVISYKKDITYYANFYFRVGMFYDTKASLFDYGAWLSLRITPSSPLFHREKGEKQ